MAIRTDKPLDYSGQVWRGIDDKFPKRIKNATTTSDGLMSAEDKAKLDSINVDDYQDIYDVASWESDGLMSKDDKKKLDGVEENANNYIHPDTPEIRHVTDAQISYWNAKASTAVATQLTDGLMSAADKKKLDDIEEYIEGVMTEHENDPEIRHVTNEQIAYWNNKAEKAVATQDADGLMSAEDKRKLDHALFSYSPLSVHPLFSLRFATFSKRIGTKFLSPYHLIIWCRAGTYMVITNSSLRALMTATPVSYSSTLR